MHGAQSAALEHPTQLVFRHVIHRHRRANFNCQHEMQPAVDDFLVAPDGLEDFVGPEIRDRRQRTELRDQLRERLAFALRQRAARDAQVRGREHAQRDRFSVPIAAVSRHGLERVAHRVPEVEDAAQPAFALVFGHDLRLDAARLDDRRQQHVGIFREDLFRVTRDAIEQLAAGDHSVLDHFVEARAELAPRQRLQQQRIDRDDRRLMERADHVLAERVVDADLAADRAVHLRQQRRRHVREGDAAEIGRRCKASGVADDAAADRDDRAAAISAGADERLVDA